MRYLKLITFFCVLPTVTWSQIEITKVTFSARNIPALHTMKDWNGNYSKPEIWSFGFAIDTALTTNGDLISFSASSSGGAYGSSSDRSIAFRIDTVVNKLYQFSYSAGSQEEIGHFDKAWTSTSASFDSVPLYRYGNGYRGYLSGASLSESKVALSDGSYSEYGIGSVAENSHVSTGVFTDSSYVEVLLYGSIPLDVASDRSQADLTIFPNPASDLLYISTSNIEDRIQFYDIMGRTIRSEVMHSGQGYLMVDVSSLLPGKYYFRQGQQVRKVVIVK